MSSQYYIIDDVAMAVLEGSQVNIAFDNAIELKELCKPETLYDLIMIVGDYEEDLQDSVDWYKDKEREGLTKEEAIETEKAEEEHILKLQAMRKELEAIKKLVEKD